MLPAEAASSLWKAEEVVRDEGGKRAGYVRRGGLLLLHPEEIVCRQSLAEQMSNIC